MVAFLLVSRSNLPKQRVPSKNGTVEGHGAKIPTICDLKELWSFHQHQKPGTKMVYPVSTSDRAATPYPSTRVLTVALLGANG